MLGAVVLTTTAQVVYTVPSAGTQVAVSIFLSNTSSTTTEPVQIEVSSDGTNWFSLFTGSVPSGETIQITNLVLEPNDQVRAKALNTANIVHLVLVGVSR